jgi:GNAT superfamily N-acetyltransferase
VSISFEERAPDDPLILGLYADFIRETDTELGLEVVEAELEAGPPRDLVPPNGVMLVALRDGEPAALGGVRHLDTEVAEVKSMYVVPAHRGAGVGSAVLSKLEAIARDRGCVATRLDTSDYLTPAVALYRSAGYIEVPDYNGNPKANLWFERRSNVQN